MKTKLSRTKEFIDVTWDPTSKSDREAAFKFMSDRTKAGWSASYSIPCPPSPGFPASSSWGMKLMGLIGKATLHDYIHSSARHIGGRDGSRDISMVLRQLADIGLSPSLSCRGYGKKAVFRFHMDTARNWWADHKSPVEAVRKAILFWVKCGRPILGPLPSMIYQSDSEEEDDRKTLKRLERARAKRKKRPVLVEEG